MRRSQQRLLVLAAALVLFLLLSGLLYQVGMRVLEGKPRTFWQSFEWASETLSTTGYGSDNRWEHPVMVVFVIFVQIVGIFIVPLAVSLYLLPFLAERFEEKVPRAAGADLAGHVIVYRYGPAVETLLLRLQEAGVLSLVVEIDEKEARGVMERGQPVVFSRSDDDALDVSRVGAARAIVANGTDQENAALTLRARQMGFTGEIYSFVEEPAHRKAMELAGATAAYTPRHIVAAALAAHASDRLSPRLPGLEQLDGVERREIRVPVQSPVAGKMLAEAQLGATVVGAWSRSRIMTRCTREMRIEPGATLELVGDAASLDAAAKKIGAPFLHQRGPFLIAGFGEVGRKVHQLLCDAGEDVRVIERTPGPGVDVVGDVLDATVLDRAGVAEARAVVLALDSDDATLFATVIMRDAAVDVPVIARVNHGRNLQNIHRAGADFALSISDISGEMLSSRLLGKMVIAREEHRRVVQRNARDYAGRAVRDLPLRANGCSVLAVTRGGDIIRGVTPETRIEDGDVLWICGTTDALRVVG